MTLDSGAKARALPPRAQRWEDRRRNVTRHFDDGAERWADLASDRPLSRIRETVRQGRREMQDVLLAALPHRLDGLRILDAGCGVGALTSRLAERGATVVGIDVSEPAINEARERLEAEGRGGQVEFRLGDMLSLGGDRFDHVVAMDWLIHYEPHEVVHAMEVFAVHASSSVLFTFAPRTPLLAVMHVVGRAIPWIHHRAPPIHPLRRTRLEKDARQRPALREWRLDGTHRVSRGFYTSEAAFLRREPRGEP